MFPEEEDDEYNACEEEVEESEEYRNDRAVHIPRMKLAVGLGWSWG